MKPYRIVVLVFCLVGAIFFAVGFIGGHITDQFLQTAQSAEGVVVETDAARTQTAVRFPLPDGAEQVSRCSYYSSDLRVGDAVTVYYDPDDPASISVDGLRVLWLIFEALGGAFVVAALIVQLCGLAGERRRDDLLRNGREVTARISEIRVNPNVAVNQYHPYRIYATVTDERGDEHRFHSPDLWRDPTPDIREETVKVRVDGDNWKRYAMDLPSCGVDYTSYETLKAAKASRT